jgi:hypothetical protein
MKPNRTKTQIVTWSVLHFAALVGVVMTIIHVTY